MGGFEVIIYKSVHLSHNRHSESPDLVQKRGPRPVNRNGGRHCRSATPSHARSQQECLPELERLKPGHHFPRIPSSSVKQWLLGEGAPGKAAMSITERGYPGNSHWGSCGRGYRRCGVVSCGSSGTGERAALLELRALSHTVLGHG